jgi:cyclophilin family peptidyl-prolyl cis-trans isomerase
VYPSCAELFVRRDFVKTVYTLTALALLASVATAANPVVEIKTSKGTIQVELYEKDAPITVKNFLAYVDKKHYDGTIFHRVISDFMIQGGGMTKDMKEKDTDKPIKNESTNGLENKRGTIAMARTRVADSATAQFFINVKDNSFLDKKNAMDGVGYCVFGRVISGMDVVDKIKEVKTRRGDVPVETVEITSVRRVEK